MIYKYVLSGAWLSLARESMHLTTVIGKWVCFTLSLSEQNFFLQVSSYLFSSSVAVSEVMTPRKAKKEKKKCWQKKYWDIRGNSRGSSKAWIPNKCTRERRQCWSVCEWCLSFTYISVHISGRLEGKDRKSQTLKLISSVAACIC